MNMNRPDTFTATEAATIARFFARLTDQVRNAWEEGRIEDALSMARLQGGLTIDIFGFPGVETVFDAHHDADDAAADARAAVQEEYRWLDMDAAYERMVDEQMGCM